MTAARKIRPVEPEQAQVHPVLQALARAPMGPPDPPEVRAAMREGKELGRFVSGSEVSAEIARRRRACTKPSK
jgi:hypothetical protein